VLTEETGDLLASGAEALVNPVNTVGVMGAGLALQFRRAFPGNYAQYRQACLGRQMSTGRVHLTFMADVPGPRYIANFPTKRHYRDESRLADIEAGLADLRRLVLRHRIASIAVPALGCGLGGLDWADVKPLITAALGSLPGVHVMLYAPAGGR
jgi:O-acetyl-ADP-ribose deacetylase (regulator of RNase III)